jgi:hypothetical protein
VATFAVAAASPLVATACELKADLIPAGSSINAGQPVT